MNFLKAPNFEINFGLNLFIIRDIKKNQMFLLKVV